MALETVRTILVAASDVTDLVEQRVSPMVRAQDEEVPAVTLELLSRTPMDVLTGAPSLHLETIRVNAWASTYDEALEVSEACRTALEAAGLHYRGPVEQYAPAVNEYLVSGDFSIWE